MSDLELDVGDFNSEAYEHVLPEGAHDFDDYDSDYSKENPELGYSDEQVAEVVSKMGKEERQLYEQCKEFLDTYYRQHGRIIEMGDLIKLIMTRRFPEIPSATKKEQDELRGQLMIEARKREALQKQAQRTNLQERLEEWYLNLSRISSKLLDRKIQMNVPSLK